MGNQVEMLRKELETAHTEINRLTDQVKTLQAGSSRPPIIGQDIFDALRERDAAKCILVSRICNCPNKTTVEISQHEMSCAYRIALEDEVRKTPTPAIIVSRGF
jgi:hypothetical protein